jgi:hypothetical protein
VDFTANSRVRHLSQPQIPAATAECFSAGAGKLAQPSLDPELKHVQPLIFGALSVMLSASAMAGAPQACELQAAVIEAAVQLPFEKFDLAQKHYMLPFHTGQMFALAGDYEKGIAYIEQGYSKMRSTTINWNAYVDANLAFLRRDRAELVKQRGIIDQQPVLSAKPGIPKEFVGTKVNLKVVDAFIACFDESYAVAFDECAKRDKQ